MAFQKGNKLGKAAKKAAEPKKEVKAAVENKAEEVKDSDVWRQSIRKNWQQRKA